MSTKIKTGSFVKVGDKFIEIAKIKNINTGNVKLIDGQSFTVTDQTEILTAEEMAAQLGSISDAPVIDEAIVINEAIIIDEVAPVVDEVAPVVDEAIIIDEVVADDKDAVRALTAEEELPMVNKENNENNELRVKLSEAEAKNASLQKMYSELETKYNATLGNNLKLQAQVKPGIVFKKAEPIKAESKMTASDIL